MKSIIGKSIINYLNESSELTNYTSLISKMACGDDIYFKLPDFVDLEENDGSNIFKLDYEYSPERPEDYDEGYVDGWEKGKDEEYDRLQREKFDAATRAYENGDVYALNGVSIKDGKIEYTGFSLLLAYGDEELIDNLKYYNAVPISAKAVYSFEEIQNESIKLKEAINQENKEINEIIGKVLKNKGTAKKYEEILKSKGITIDYNSPEGVTLIGSNGEKLSSSRNTVVGPSKPGHNNTHIEAGDSKYRIKRNKDEIQEYRDEIKKYKGLSDRQLISNFGTDSLDDAKEERDDAIKWRNSRIRELNKLNKEYEIEDKENVKDTKRVRRSGHEHEATDIENDRETANSTIDYLNYLTKPKTNKPYTNFNRDYDGRKYEYDEEDGGYDEEYFGRNGRPEYNETLSKYDDLKDEVDKAERHLSDKYYDSYMTKNQLEKEIEKRRKKFDKDIENLKASNERDKQNHDNLLRDAREKRKSLRDFLKSKGVNTSNKSIKKESADFSKLTSEDFLNSTIEVYDLQGIVDIINEENDTQYHTYRNERAILQDTNGRYIISDYEAVREIADSPSEKSVVISLYNPDGETEIDGKKVKTFSIAPSYEATVSVDAIKKYCSSKTMKASEFFTRHDYNMRCQDNFAGLIRNLNGIYR